MAPDDDHDDVPRGRPLPPEDRLWRHPSEMAGQPTGPQIVVIEKAAPGPGPGHTLFVAVLSLLVGAGGATGVLLATDLRLRERPGTTSREVRDVTPGSPGDSEIAIAETVLESVARVESTSRKGAVNATAVVFRSDGQLITTAEAVDGAEQITVVLRNGRRITGPDVKLVGRSLDADIAVLKIPVTDLPVAAATTRPVKFGKRTVLVDGSLVTRGPIIAVGVVTRETAQVNRERAPTIYGLIETTTRATVTAGPGTLLLDDVGSVTGLVTGRAGTPKADAGTAPATSRSTVAAARTGLTTVNPEDADKALHYAVPADYAWSIAAQLVDTRQVVKPWVGLPQGDDITVDEANRDQIQGGMRVTVIEDASPARAANLQLDDVVVALGEHSVRSYNEFVTALRRQRPGTEVKITVIHKGEYVPKLITVGGKPEQ